MKGKEMNDYVSYSLMQKLFTLMADYDGDTLLRVMRKAGPDVNFADPFGMTLLMHAVRIAARGGETRASVLDSIAYLVMSGADVNLADDRGETALSLALKLRQKDIATMFFHPRRRFPINDEYLTINGTA